MAGFEDTEALRVEAGYLESALQTFLDCYADTALLREGMESVVVGFLRLVKELRKEVYLAQEHLLRVARKAESPEEAEKRELGLVEAYLANQRLLEHKGGTEALLARPRAAHYQRLLPALRLFASLAPEQPYAGSPYAMVRSRRGSAEREASSPALLATLQSAAVQLVDLVAPDGSLVAGAGAKAAAPVEAAVDAEADLYRLQRALIDIARRCQRSPARGSRSPRHPSSSSTLSPAISPRPISSGPLLAPPGAGEPWPPRIPSAPLAGTSPHRERRQSAPSSPAAGQRRHSLEPFVLSPRPPEAARSPRSPRTPHLSPRPAAADSKPEAPAPPAPPRELTAAEKAFVERMWQDRETREKRLADARAKREKEGEKKEKKEVDVSAFVSRMEGDAKSRETKLKAHEAAEAKKAAEAAARGAHPVDVDAFVQRVEADLKARREAVAKKRRESDAAVHAAAVDKGKRVDEQSFVQRMVVDVKVRDEAQKKALNDNLKRFEANVVGAGKVVSETEFVRRMSADVQGREAARAQLYGSLAAAPPNLPHAAVISRRRSSAPGPPSPPASGGPSPTASPQPIAAAAPPSPRPAPSAH